MKFTFYGDLLGMGAAYRLGGDIAYNTLSEFYNEAFSCLTTFCQNSENKVEMFSDSIFIMGDDAFEAVDDIAHLYSNLLRKGILLRGAMVSGELEYDRRVVRENFGKRLPVGDVLARAVGLESSQKGARFLIESALAAEFFQQCPDWSTHVGYSRSHINSGPDLLRRICPTPDDLSYEYLYYWSLGVQFSEYETRIQGLRSIQTMSGSAVSPHYEATVDLIKRCQRRHEMTDLG